MGLRVKIKQKTNKRTMAKNHPRGDKNGEAKLQKGLRVKWNFIFKKVKTITTNIFIVTSRLSFI
jgi:hypothetical protein